MQVNVSTCNVSFEINKYVCKKFKIIRKLDKQNIMSSELNWSVNELKQQQLREK